MPRPRVKARHANECHSLEQLPNIGPTLAAGLRSVGVESPGQLRKADGFELYLRLCQVTGQRQDPCVLDTFLAITDFMQGAAPNPWWAYTGDRKRRFPLIGMAAHPMPNRGQSAPP